MMLDAGTDKTTDSKDADPTRRRRIQDEAAKEILDKARVAVSALDSSLELNATQAETQQRSMDSAREEIVRSKAKMKAGAKERERLTAAREKAIKTLAKAKHKAEVAEAKYDQAILADMVQREKQNAQTGSQQEPTSPSHHSTVAGPYPTSGTSEGAAPSSSPSDAPPERESLASSTARLTAAHATATQAGTTTGPAQPTTPATPE